MKKFLPFSRRQPSLDRYAVNRGGWAGSDRFNGKSMRRTSATSLNIRSIQVVRGAYNIDLNKVDTSFTKLHKACLLNDDAQVKKHLHKVDNNSRDSSNRYPIHLATVNGNSAIVKLLIENQANPNVKDNEGNTPLIKSIECGHEHLVKYLLNNGADPNLSDLNNNTPLHWAIMTESLIATEALISSKKCDLSLKNNKDETYLHLAVRSSLINTLRFETIIKAGCDINAKDKSGATALDIAINENNNTAINVLNRFLEINKRDVETATDARNQSDIDTDKQASAMKMCEKYRLKYITKNRENLEYEKELIQIRAQIERLMLDMTYMKEQNEKLENDVGRLSAENFRLKDENGDLLEQIEKLKEEREAGAIIAAKDSTQSESNIINKNIDLENVDSVWCRVQEEFLVAEANNREKINLKYAQL